MLVNKKKSKKKEVSEDPPCESGDVHSVVSIPSAPEIPQVTTPLGRAKLTQT